MQKSAEDLNRALETMAAECDDLLETLQDACDCLDVATMRLFVELVTETGERLKNAMRMHAAQPPGMPLTMAETVLGLAVERLIKTATTTREAEDLIFKRLGKFAEIHVMSDGLWQIDITDPGNASVRTTLYARRTP